jgi:hypothetical protein
MNDRPFLFFRPNDLYTMKLYYAALNTPGNHLELQWTTEYALGLLISLVGF